MNAHPSVTIVVVTYNSDAHLARLLPTLDDGLAGVEHWRLVIVDNASSDDTLATAQRLRPDGKVIEMGRNAGYAAAINAGVGLASEEDVILVLNPDIRLRRGCVQRLLSGLQRPGTGIAVPRLIDPAGRTSPSLRRDPSVRIAWAEALLGGHRAAGLKLSEVIRSPEAYEKETTVDWATGAILAISPECRAALGEWDESYFLYSEEVDYCQRARHKGFTVRYIPEALAEHVGGPHGSNRKLWSLQIRNRYVHFARGSGRLRSTGFRAGLATGEALRAPRSPSARAGFTAAVTAPRPARQPGFVWFAAQDWWYHNQAHSDFQLMQEVACDRPVLLVNSLGLRMPRRGVSTNPGRRIGRKLRSMAKLVRRPVPQLPNYHVMTPIMLPLYGPGMPARVNAWFIRQQVRMVGRMIGVGPEPLIGLTIPTAWPVVRHMAGSVVLYNRSDLHSAFPEADREWVAGLEDELIRRADRVLYVSHELMAADAELVGGRGVFLGHGVDLDHFAMADESNPAESEDPPEMRGIPRPRIGFFGGINDYNVDIELFAETARAIPEASLVIIGDANCPIDELLTVPNIFWLGRQPYARIPALGRAFDVALMPWLNSEWIRFANPIKLKEYLALGLPVVSTDYPEVHHGNSHVAVAASREDFPRLVRAALTAPGNPSELRQSVLQSSWSERARALIAIAETARRA